MGPAPRPDRRACTEPMTFGLYLVGRVGQALAHQVCHGDLRMPVGDGVSSSVFRNFRFFFFIGAPLLARPCGRFFGQALRRCRIRMRMPAGALGMFE